MNDNNEALKNISDALQEIVHMLKAIEASGGILTADEKRTLLKHITGLTVDAALLDINVAPAAIQPWPDEAPTASVQPAPVVAVAAAAPVMPPTPVVPELPKTPASVVPVTPAASATSKHSLQEAAQQNTSSLNERFGAPSEKNIAGKLGVKPISRLAQGVPLNERIQFTKHLFNGNEQAYTAAITQLDTFANEQQALQYIHNVLKPMYKWHEDDTMIQAIADLVRRRYSL